METHTYDPGSEALRKVLLDGRVESGGRSRPVRVARVEWTPERRVVLEEIDASAGGARPSAIATWLQAGRLISLTATATPIVATALYARWVGLRMDVHAGLFAFVGALLLQLAVNLLNDVEDHLRLVDAPGTLGGAGVIQKGWLSAREVRNVAYGSAALGLLCGVPGFLNAPGPLMAVALAAVVGTLGYSSKRLGLKYRALGDLTVVLLCGPVLTLGFSFAAYGTADAGTALLGGLFGFAAVGILHANNLQDIDHDVATGARTVASVLGETRAKAYFGLVYVLGALSLVAFVFGTGVSTWALVPVALAAVPVSKFVSSMVRAKDLKAPEFTMARVTAAQFHLLLGIATCVGLGVALWLK